MAADRIAAMYARPGIWVLLTGQGVTFVEVMPDGRCWSLRPGDMSRDNELSRDGWTVHPLTFGPFLRAES